MTNLESEEDPPSYRHSLTQAQILTIRSYRTQIDFVGPDFMEVGVAPDEIKLVISSGSDVAIDLYERFIPEDLSQQETQQKSHIVAGEIKKHVGESEK